MGILAQDKANQGSDEAPEYPQPSDNGATLIGNREPGAQPISEADGSEDDEYDESQFQQSAPLPIKGTAVMEAKYHDPIVTRYRDNPYIEALPRILSIEEATSLLEELPPYRKVARKWSTELRIHEVRGIQHVRIVLPNNLKIEHMVACAIRDGYVSRNPLRKGNDQHIRELSKAAREALEKDEDGDAEEFAVNFEHDLDTGSYGFTIIGVSGGGKTSALVMALSLLPEVIIHSHYDGKPLPLLQLTYLRLECPKDGSIKGLQLAFFRKVDKKLGTKYYERYAHRGRATVDAMVEDMVEVAMRHGLGLLCIDEIQNLVEVKNNPREMLNFLVQLNNSIGVPVVLVGTYKAGKLFRKGLRYARRGSGQGDVVIDKLENGPVWEIFIQDIWRYQYTRTETPLSQELHDTLYEESQGIPDIAIKILMLAQARAIMLGANKEDGSETITPSMIKWVARNQLQLVQPVLDALRSNDFGKLDELDDITIDVDAMLRDITNKANLATLKARQEAKQKSGDTAARKESGSVGTQTAEVPEPAPKKSRAKGKSQPKSLEELKEEGYFEAGNAYVQ